MKSLILLEMAVLAGGAVLSKHRKSADWQQTLLHDDLRALIAVLILTVLLLTLDEVGLGGVAAGFGGLVALGYALGAVGWLGPAVQSAESQLFA
jgi:hypothetical protein